MAKVYNLRGDVANLAAFMNTGNDTGGGGDGGMEARIARLEAHVEHIDKTLTEIRQDIRDLRGDGKDFRGEIKEIRQEARTDFRLTFGALIAVAIGLAGMMAKGFGWLN